MSVKKQNASKPADKRKAAPTGRGIIVRGAKSGTFGVMPANAKSEEWVVRLEGVVVTRSKREASEIARRVKDGRMNVVVEKAAVERVTADEFDRMFDEGLDISAHLDVDSANWVPPLKKK